MLMWGIYSPQVQAAQVRKSSIGGLGLGGYHPNTHHAYTVHSGTNVEQVSAHNFIGNSDVQLDSPSAELLSC